MTTPESGPSGADGDAPQAGDPAADPPFDPYRFGKPDRPIPPEYAPPGYTPPPPTEPAVSPTSPYGPGSPYGSAPPSYGSPPPPYGSAPPPSGSSPYDPPPPYGTPPPYGQQPYGSPPPYPGPYPGGYGAPPPPGYHGYVQPKSGNGKAIAAMVLGILSIVFFWLSVFDGIFVILAVIFGLIALSESKAPGGSGRGMAISGLVCCLIGAILATIITVKLFHAIDKCGGFDNNNGSVFNQCLKDNL